MVPLSRQTNHTRLPAGENSSTPVRFTSFLGDNGLEFYRQVAAYLGRATGIPAEFTSDVPPETREKMVRREQIQVVFTCGLPYVKKADRRPSQLQLMAAPVLNMTHYQDKPVYFSNVIVRAGSSYHCFEALRGTIFVYNEVHSFSGYMLPSHHLLTLGQTDNFFSKAICSGSHAVSMNWVEQDRAAAAAIDSVIFDMEMAQRPERARVFRIVARLGPCPMPPVAAVTGLEKDRFLALRKALLAMHTTENGQAILEQANVRRFEMVSDSDYDIIRRILRDLNQAHGLSFS